MIVLQREEFAAIIFVLNFLTEQIRSRLDSLQKESYCLSWQWHFNCLKLYIVKPASEGNLVEPAGKAPVLFPGTKQILHADCGMESCFSDT